MSRRVVVRDDARLDVLDIAGTIAAGRIGAGIRFLDAFDSTCRFLAEYPRVGTLRSPGNPALGGLRPYEVRGFRNYLVFFLPLSDGVLIARVRHGAMDHEHWLGKRE